MQRRHIQKNRFYLTLCCLLSLSAGHAHAQDPLPTEPPPTAPPPIANPLPAPQPEPPPTPTQPPEPPPTQNKNTPGRPAELKTITWNASAQVHTLAPERARADLITALEGMGVYIQSNQDFSFDLRVPTDRFEQVVALLQHRADVIDLTTSSQDVALEWSNLVARQRVLQESRLRLIEMLSLSATVSDTLLVERELNDVTHELESIQGRLKSLNHRIQYAPLTLSITQRSNERPRLQRANNQFAWVSNYGPSTLLQGSH